MGAEIHRRQSDEPGGYGLTTANILYHMPDYPGVLQTFLWQNYDTAPAFPALNRFLAFWTHAIDGPLHSVQVAHKSLVRQAELRQVGSIFMLH